MHAFRGGPHTGTTTSTIANEASHVTLSMVWIGWLAALRTETVT
jgi:hypothetical protein